MSRTTNVRYGPAGPPARIRGAVLGLILLAGSVGAAAPAFGLPPGKSWSAVIDTFKIPGHTFGVAPKRLELDPLGDPVAFVEAIGGIGRDMYVLRWKDSTWIPVANLGYGTKGVQPVPAPEGTYHLIWAGLEEIEPALRSYLVMNQFAGESLTSPDTVTTIWTASLRYAAAASTRRRWAAAEDYGDLRLLYSDSSGAWTEVPVPGRGDNGLALAVMDDTSAVLAWRDLHLGPGAGILRGMDWTLIAPPPMTGLLDAAPRFRARPSGGYWLSWATAKDFVGLAAYHDGAWSLPDSIFCAYLRPGSHRSQSRAEMSRDHGEYPAVSWMAVSAVNGLTSVCVCVPSDSGFTIAENIPGSEEGISPVVALDRNQDVWVTWRAPDGMGWTHTYTHATASTPTVTGGASERLVNWTLSEPAPGSWWAVLRAGESEPFEEVARLKAGQGLTMTWTDLSPPTSPLRYRIRRECLHRQYQWLSEETLWSLDVPPSSSGTGRLRLRLASGNPSGTALRLDVLNAGAGPLEIQAHDVRGRLLLRQRATASGSGQDAIPLDLATAGTPPRAGLYLLRVIAADGTASPSAKAIVLR